MAVKNTIALLIKKITILSFLLVAINVPTAVSGVIHIINEDGKLTGAKNISIAGTLYDVAFKDGSFSTIFGSSQSLDTTSYQQAAQFSQALLDQVFIDNTLFGTYWDSRPYDTFGCKYGQYATCSVLTPFYFNSIQGFVSVAASINDYKYGDMVSNGGQLYKLTNTSSDDGKVYADWSLAVVPLPSALSLFLLSLIGLRFSRKK